MKQTISPVFLLGKCSEVGQTGHFYPAPWWLLHTPWPHAVHSCSLCLCPLSSSWQSGHWCSERWLWNLNIILNNLWNLNIILNNLYINTFVSFLTQLSLLPESTVGINGTWQLSLLPESTVGINGAWQLSLLPESTVRINGARQTSHK